MSVPVSTDGNYAAQYAHDYDNTMQTNTQEVDMYQRTEPMGHHVVRWRRVQNAQGSLPRPRHGHRAVAVRDMMIIFGGGNEGIIDELHVYNASVNQWFVPQMRREIPPGTAAFGIACDGVSSMYTFGGMVEYGRYSNDLHELQVARWEWKRLKPRPPKEGGPIPVPRLGHSFVMDHNKICYLFGGLTNQCTDVQRNSVQYLDDFYRINMAVPHSSQQWEKPMIYGIRPCARESHTAVLLEDQYKMIVYGGMNGCRLGDVWILDLSAMIWTNPQIDGIPPLPRSLHTANIIDHKMYIYGGWVPMSKEEDGGFGAGDMLETTQAQWKCTNTVGILDLDTLSWQNTNINFLDSVDAIPRARAGHSSTVINNRIYIFSGRDGYRKAWNNQVCCKDLWYLETDRPAQPGKAQLVRAQINALDISWTVVPTAEAYLVQISKVDPVKERNAMAGRSVVRVGNQVKVVRTVGSGAQVVLVKPPTSRPIVFKAANQQQQQQQSQQSMLQNAPGGLTNNQTPSGSQADGAYGSAGDHSNDDNGGLPQNLLDEVDPTPPSDPSPSASTKQDEDAIGVEGPSVSRSDAQNGNVDVTDPSTSAGNQQQTNVGGYPKDPDANSDVDSAVSSMVLLSKAEPEEEWFDVAIVKGNTCNVDHYFLPGGYSLEAVYGTNEYERQVDMLRKSNLEGGCGYRFRIAGLNGLGRGPWSEVNAPLKTCLPGYPGAPSSIKITKGKEGALLTWEPPAQHTGIIIEYSVYLAVRNASSESDAQLAFMRVYVGERAECVVASTHLTAAYVDTSNKPAIIFRIAAKNEKGYGPATQVRWLQDQTKPMGGAQAQPRYVANQGHGTSHAMMSSGAGYYPAMKKTRMD